MAKIFYIFLFGLSACSSDKKNLHNIFEKYYENGKIRSRTEGFYAGNKDSFVADGIYRSYYENGNLKIKCSFKSNVQNGWAVFYDSFGNIMDKEFSFYGEPYGPHFHYYENGNLKSIVNYLADSVASLAVFFDDSGKVERFDGSSFTVFIDTPDSFHDIVANQLFVVDHIITPLPKIRTLIIVQILLNDKIISRDTLDDLKSYDEFNLTKFIDNKILRQPGKYTYAAYSYLIDSMTQAVLKIDTVKKPLTVSN